MDEPCNSCNGTEWVDPTFTFTIDVPNRYLLSIEIVGDALEKLAEFFQIQAELIIDQLAVSLAPN